MGFSCTFKTLLTVGLAFALKASLVASSLEGDPFADSSKISQWGSQDMRTYGLTQAQCESLTKSINAVVTLDSPDVYKEQGPNKRTWFNSGVGSKEWDTARNEKTIYCEQASPVVLPNHFHDIRSNFWCDGGGAMQYNRQYYWGVTDVMDTSQAPNCLPENDISGGREHLVLGNIQGICGCKDAKATNL